MKQIKEDTNKWKGVLCSWIEGLNTAAIPLLPKVIYTFSALCIKIPMAENTIMKPQKALPKLSGRTSA
jgi:hypothetical protein